MAKTIEASTVRELCEPNKPFTSFTAGPSEVHQISDDRELALLYLKRRYEYLQMTHRGKEAAELLKDVTRMLFEILHIPKELRDVPFDPENTMNGWHVAFSSSGTDGMQKAIRAACEAEGTLLIDTDEFSEVAGKEMKEFGRKHEMNSFERGKGLKPGTPEFEEVAKKVEKGEIRTLYITENATTNGAYQRKAVEELVRRRNASGSKTLIVVDAVSSQIYGREWDHTLLPDVIFWANQKDPGVGPGTGNVIYNNRALARAHEISLDRGGKLGLLAAEKINRDKPGNTPQTPALGLIFEQQVVLRQVTNPNGVERDRIQRMQKEARKRILEAMGSQGELGSLGFSLVTDDPELLSDTTFVMRVPKGVSAKALAKALEEKHQIRVATGYGEFADEEIRICVYSANTIYQVVEALHATVTEATILKPAA